MNTADEQAADYAENGEKRRRVLDFPHPAPTGDQTGKVFLIKFKDKGFLRAECAIHQADRLLFSVELDGETRQHEIWIDDFIDAFSVGHIKPTD